MGHATKLALLGSALIFLPAAAALAADLPSIPPAPVVIGGAWYLRGDIGLTNQSVGSLFNAQYDAVGYSLDHQRQQGFRLLAVRRHRYRLQVQ